MEDAVAAGQLTALEVIGRISTGNQASGCLLAAKIPRTFASSKKVRCVTTALVPFFTATDRQAEGPLTRITVGADKAYDTKDFVSTVQELNVTPQVTKNDKVRRSNLDRGTTRQPVYAVSLSRRWLIEKAFGWLKQTGPLRQVKLRSLEKVDWLFVFSCAAHNLIRLPRLMAQPPGRLMEGRLMEQRA
jgi:hypothetical protein